MTMFGDLFGDLQQRQAAMQEQLAALTVEAEAGDGAVRVLAGGDLRIRNIKVDPALLTDAEALEDLLVVAVNRALDDAKAKAAEATSALLKDMLPPGGMGGLFQ